MRVPKKNESIRKQERINRRVRIHSNMIVLASVSVCIMTRNKKGIQNGQ